MGYGASYDCRVEHVGMFDVVDVAACPVQWSVVVNSRGPLANVAWPHLPLLGSLLSRSPPVASQAASIAARMFT